MLFSCTLHQLYASQLYPASVVCLSAVHCISCMLVSCTLHQLYASQLYPASVIDWLAVPSISYSLVSCTLHQLYAGQLYLSLSVSKRAITKLPTTILWTSMMVTLLRHLWRVPSSGKGTNGQSCRNGGRHPLYTQDIIK